MPDTAPVLEFERPVVELEQRLERMRALAATRPDVAGGIEPLQAQLDALRRDTFGRLTRWQIVQLCRHPARPSPLDYIERLMPDLVELQGDRRFGDDPAIVGGPATFDGRPVMVVAHARGRNPAEQEARRFGMPRPEGFFKVERLVQLADRLGLPVVTFVDTPGAYPGADAEERGQALAIARCLETLSAVRVPVVACVTGEGQSGGALALSVADKLLIQEYGVFAVISPEACSSILHRDGRHAAESAESLRLTARDLHAQKLVDEVVPEPAGGAHRDVERAVRLMGEAAARALRELVGQPEDRRRQARYRRLRSYGAHTLQEG